MKSARIESFQALRALAFLGIFFDHSGLSNLKWSELAVSIFFVLSGYLSYYKHSNQVFDYSIKESIIFTQKKIIKLYPLHIITMLLAIALFIVKRIKDYSLATVIYLAGSSFLNIFLLQAWIPHTSINTSLNGVAWYLSVSAFLYFIFPYIKRFICRKDRRFLSIMCVCILILEITICVPLVVLLGRSNPIYIWFMYCFPLFRLGDYFIGCCLGKLYNKAIPKHTSTIKASFYDVVIILLSILTYSFMKQSYTNPLLIALQNWTTLYIPLAVLWVLLYSSPRGIITMLFVNRITIFIGNITNYAFLTHFIVLQYVNYIIETLNIEMSYWNNIVRIITSFLITIITSYGCYNFNAGRNNP